MKWCKKSCCHYINTTYSGPGTLGCVAYLSHSYQVFILQLCKSFPLFGNPWQLADPYRRSCWRIKKQQPLHENYVISFGGDLYVTEMVRRCVTRSGAGRFSAYPCEQSVFKQRTVAVTHHSSFRCSVCAGASRRQESAFVDYKPHSAARLSFQFIIII